MCRSRGLLDVTTTCFHDTNDVYTRLAATVSVDGLTLTASPSSSSHGPEDE